MDNTRVGDFFRNKWVRFVILIDIIVVILTIVLLITNSKKSSSLTFNIVPIDAKISINGTEFDNESSYSLAPGSYEIQISHDDLISKTLSIQLEPDSNLTISTFLSGEENNLEFYKQKQNYTSFLKLAEIASKGNNLTFDSDNSAESFIDRIETAIQLTNSALPVEYQEYAEVEGGRELTKDITVRQNYNEKCETYLCLKALMLYTDDTNFTNDLLKEKGFNLEDYEIFYETF